MSFSIFRKKEKRPINMLPRGWQFYSRPNNLETPGTIFRIDSKGVKYIVSRLAPEIYNTPEPGTSKVEKTDTKVGILARLLGLEPVSAKVSGSKVKTLEFEIVEPIRNSTYDIQIDKVLYPFLQTMEYKAKNKYYIIRESRSAIAMKFRLSDSLLGELGGAATITEVARADLKISAKQEGFNELCQDFPERLGVMFLPEEIAPVRQGLAAGGTELGRLQVKSLLEWFESEES